MTIAMTDEWDEFLSRASSEPASPKLVAQEPEQKPTENDDIQLEKKDLCDFGDNAEVLMQMARGESYNALLSSNGIWINSTTSKVNTKGSPAVNAVFGKKRALKESVVPSVPIANTFQDMTRALSGHPILSHPLSLLKQNSSPISEPSSAVEIDSLGLFFYGSPGSVKIESNVRDDIMKVIELKKNLLDKSLMISETGVSLTCNTPEISNDNDGIKMIISHENLKIISSSIPPNGKTNWLIPFTVTPSGRIDLSEPGCHVFSDQSGYFYEFCNKMVGVRISELMETSEHVIILDDKKILIKTVSPAYTISINFRGSHHSDPFSDPVNFLFSRQSNTSIEVDFESLKVTAVRSFVPKFDQQSRVFLLLRALEGKVSGLPEGNYLLKHVANVPFIKILRL